MSFSSDFGPFGNHVWLNCAHQGPIPQVAAAAAREAITWKQQPYELTVERFSGIPARLKKALARLINASTDEVILANSASYGMHLLANGLPLKAGDEILLSRGDFPSVILPWLGLEKRGIKIRFVDPANKVITPEELQTAISPATRLFCATWVHSFSGRATDLKGIGEVCKSNGLLFIANTTQAIGTKPFDVQTAPVDAITNVGFKWLCGPYGTGFCWIRKPVLESMTYNQSYWLSLQTSDDLGKPSQVVSLPDTPPTSKTYDIFGTANFFNYVPWTASIEYLLDIGVDKIIEHDQTLVQHLIDNFDRSRYKLLSPESGNARSNLTLFSHVQPDENQRIYDELKQNNFHIAFRRGNLRVAPHIYNTLDEIDRFLALLSRLG